MIEVKGLSKKFDSGSVLKDIDLQIEDGEIYGIIGANGSGKSTFLNILNGKDTIVKTGGYEGDIFIDGEKVRILDHQHSVSHGISMVHQELALFPGMRAVDNIKINHENVKWELPVIPELSRLDEKKNLEDAKTALERIGTELDPVRNIDNLSLNQKQFVEIARELDHQNIRLLMLDEPTSSLNITETEKLLSCVQEIASRGISVIFVSHRLEEIEKICHRVSVFRDGRLISTYKKADFDLNRFAEDMVGQKIVKAARERRQLSEETILEYRCRDDDGNTLTIKKGEILGITGLAGQGQEQFLAGLFGLAKTNYTTSFKGEMLKDGDTHGLIGKGIYYISENRGVDSLLLDSSIWENMIFGTEGKHQDFLSLSRIPGLSFLKRDRIRSYTEQMIEKLYCAVVGQIVKYCRLGAAALGGGGTAKLIGVGAPANSWLTAAAAQLKVPCIVPPHADVANAVGAAVGQAQGHRRGRHCDDLPQRHRGCKNAHVQCGRQRRENVRQRHTLRRQISL